MSSKSKGGMTPKERIHAAARGLPADRVPVFYWIEAHTGCKLMAEYKPSRHWNRNLLAKFLWGRFKEGGYMQAAEIWRFLPLLYDIHSYNFANAYGIDLGADMVLASYATPAYSKWGYRKRHIDVVDIYGVGRKIGGGIYPDMIDPPVKSIDDLRNFRFPDATRDSLYNIFRQYRKQYPLHSIAAEAWGPHDWTSNQMIGLEKYMTWLVEYPDELKSFMDRFIEHEIEIAHGSVRAGADVVFIYDDYGYNNRPLISMKMWREFMYPRLKKQVDAAHEDGALICLHSCGYQMSFLEYYVDMGIDMLQSFQPAAGNDFKLAVDKYGDKLCFITGIDIQRGEAMTPDEYKQDILESYRIGRAKNRHILGTTHEIQYTMPDENIRILFETVRDIQAGRYD